MIHTQIAPCPHDIPPDIRMIFEAFRSCARPCSCAEAWPASPQLVWWATNHGEKRQVTWWFAHLIMVCLFFCWILFISKSKLNVAGLLNSGSTFFFHPNFALLPKKMGGAITNQPKRCWCYRVVGKVIAPIGTIYIYILYIYIIIIYTYYIFYIYICIYIYIHIIVSITTSNWEDGYNRSKFRSLHAPSMPSELVPEHCEGPGGSAIWIMNQGFHQQSISLNSDLTGNTW